MISIQQQIKLVNTLIEEVRIQYNSELDRLNDYINAGCLYGHIEVVMGKCEAYMKEIGTWVAVLESIATAAQVILLNEKLDEAKQTLKKVPKTRLTWTWKAGQHSGNCSVNTNDSEAY